MLVRKQLFLSLFWLILLTPWNSALADSSWSKGLEFHGFLTQGYVQTTDNRFFGDSDKGSLDFTELGLNVSLRLNGKLRLAGQLLSRRAGEMYDGSPALDYGLVDYTALSDENKRLGVIAGRFKNPLGFYNDTRDVAFTRPAIFLPQSIYFDKVRNLMLSNDGLMGYGEFHSAQDSLYLQLGFGHSPFDRNVEYAYLGTDLPGDLSSDGPMLVGRILYERDGGRLRMALSGARGKAGHDSNTALIDLFYWVASLQYNTEQWSITGEYMQEPIEWSGFGPPLDNEATAEGYYLQGSYRPNSEWELFVRYEESFADKKDREGTIASAKVGGLIPPYNYFSKDWSIGARWNISDNLMLRAEYHRVDGTFMQSPREITDTTALVRHWDMLSLLVSYQF
jgi:hypothetical protein